MSTIVTRYGKGSPLTWLEVDNNFTNLNTDKIQSGDTVAALTITSATINGGTINGTTIGASTASSGAFTTLSATGVTTVQAGTVSLPAITTTGDTNTGIFFPAADTIAFTEGGTERMRIDSSGNVGIGTSSPSVVASSTTIDIRGTVGGALRFGSATTTGVLYATDSVVLLGTASNNPLLFTTGLNVERMRIDSSGNVGIGTTTTTNKLNVSGAGVTKISIANSSVSATGYMEIDNSSYFNIYTAGGMFIGPTGANPLQFQTNNTERMRIHSNGGVSIGNTTDSGAASLNVSGSMSGGYIAHAAGTTAMAFGADNVVRVTPNATATYTSTVPAAGAICVLSILTSGTTSYTITFGTGFKSTGTLATGTVSARYFNITFVSDGTNLIETSRTVAIA